MSTTDYGLWEGTRNKANTMGANTIGNVIRIRDEYAISQAEAEQVVKLIDRGVAEGAAVLQLRPNYVWHDGRLIPPARRDELVAGSIAPGAPAPRPNPFTALRARVEDAKSIAAIRDAFTDLLDILDPPTTPDGPPPDIAPGDYVSAKTATEPTPGQVERLIERFSLTHRQAEEAGRLIRSGADDDLAVAMVLAPHQGDS